MVKFFNTLPLFGAVVLVLGLGLAKAVASEENVKEEDCLKECNKKLETIKEMGEIRLKKAKDNMEENKKWYKQMMMQINNEVKNTIEESHKNCPKICADKKCTALKHSDCQKKCNPKKCKANQDAIKQHLRETTKVSVDIEKYEKELEESYKKEEELIQKSIDLLINNCYQKCKETTKPHPISRNRSSLNLNNNSSRLDNDSPGLTPNISENSENTFWSEEEKEENTNEN
jgi:uncharacterized protein YgfB (UPF0149 family)